MELVISILSTILFAQTTTVSLHLNPLAVAISVLFFAALIIAGFAQWNRQLRKKVAERTQALEEKAQALEHEVAERRTLEERQRQLIAAVEGSTDYIGIADNNGFTLYLNKAGRKMLGISEDEDLANCNIADYHPKFEHERMLTEILPTLDRDGIWLGEINLLTRGGREIPASQLIIGHKNQEGIIDYFSTVARDITQRKQAEIAFQDIQRTLVTLLSNLPGMAYRCRNDHDWTMEFVSGGARELTGYEPYALIESRVIAYNDLIHPDDQAAVWDQVQAALEKQQPFRIEYRIRTRSGDERWVWEQGRGIFGSDGKVIAIEGFINDVSDRRQMEDALRQSEERFRFLADNLPGVIYLCKNDERYSTIYLNDAIHDLVGYSKEEFLSDRVCFVDIYHPDDLDGVAEIVNKAVDRREPYHVTYRLQHRSGEWRWIEEFGIGVFKDDELLFLEGFLSDITERRQMEEVLVQSEKMLVVGGLAAGMAHEINNPISGIMQARQNIERRLSEELPANQEAAKAAGISLVALQKYLHDRGVLEHLGEIQDGAERTARIVTDLLDFSRAARVEHKEADIEATVRRAARLMATEWSAKSTPETDKIEMLIKASPNLPMIKCDDNKIEQVLLNLMRNAAQALANQTGHPNPRIDIALRSDENWLEIVVQDNGPGIDESTRQRIFEPFFTTKEVGQGTGLGLSVSYFLIVDQHNGQLMLDSAPGEGARFTIRLPR